MTISASAGTRRSTVLARTTLIGDAGDGAGHPDLIERLRHFLHRCVRDHRRTADHNRTGHRLLARLIFHPMAVNAGAQFDRWIHTEPARRFELAAIIADVLQAGIGIFCDVMTGRQIRRVVASRSRDRHRQTVEPVARLVERIAERADILTCCVGDNERLERRGKRLHPGGADVVQWAAETDAVHFADWRRAPPPARRCRNARLCRRSHW